MRAYIQKYKDALEKAKEYYYKNFENQTFLKEAKSHAPSYEKINGVSCGGNYQD